jgi:hypothetical protein
MVFASHYHTKLKYDSMSYSTREFNLSSFRLSPLDRNDMVEAFYLPAAAQADQLRGCPVLKRIRTLPRTVRLDFMSTWRPIFRTEQGKSST